MPVAPAIRETEQMQALSNTLSWAIKDGKFEAFNARRRDRLSSALNQRLLGNEPKQLVAIAHHRVWHQIVMLTQMHPISQLCVTDIFR